MSLRGVIENTINDMSSMFNLIQLTNEKRRLLADINIKQERIKEIDKLMGTIK